MVVLEPGQFFAVMPRTLHNECIPADENCTDVWLNLRQDQRIRAVVAGRDEDDEFGILYVRAVLVDPLLKSLLKETLEKELENYRIQEEKQYEFLETGRYTPDVFDKRNTALRQKMEDCQERIYRTKSTMPKEVNYEERVQALKAAIDALKDSSVPVEEQNRLLKAIVERIELKTTDAGHDAVEVGLRVDLRF